jgi:phosphoglycerate dehydrogenase-like enzyme
MTSTLALRHRELRGAYGAALEHRIGEADVLVISGLWRNDLLPRAKRLRFIQSIGAGTNQFSREALKQHGVRLASARAGNGSAAPVRPETSQLPMRSFCT